MGKIRPAVSKARQQRVTRAKSKIKKLVGKGVKTNLRSASDFTVSQVAKKSSHSQGGAARTEVKARMQAQNFRSKPDRTTAAFNSLRKSRRKK